MPSTLKKGAEGSVVTGSFAAVGQSPATEIYGTANFVLSGVFVASLRLAASFDAGVSWIPVTSADGSVRAFTAPERVILDEPEEGVLYRVECTAWTSGAANWRLSK